MHHVGDGVPRRLRSRFTALIGVALAALVVAACGGDDNGGSGSTGTSATTGSEITSDTVVFADYGGTTRTARTQAFLQPFSSDTGVRSVSADADPAKLELFAENGKAEWDMIDMDGWDVVRFSEKGLLKKLPASVTRVDLVPKELQPYASGGYNATTGFGYRTDKGEAPQTWADFFDTQKFPGKRALPNFAYFTAEAALLADGVACDDLYPLDFDRAFEKLDTIKDDVLFYDSFGQGVQYLAQGSVSMVLVPNSRVAILKDQGLPVDFQWNQGFFSWTASAVPKDAPHPDAAFALIAFQSQPEQQAQFSRLTKYGPMNSKALDVLDETTKEQLPNAHLDTACEVDNAGLAKDLDAYSEQYTKWLGG